MISSWPTVITTNDVRTELGGGSMCSFLNALGDPGLSGDALTVNIEAKITAVIQEAQSSIENRLGCFLTQRRIKTNPPTNADGTPAVLGVDYDWLDDGFNYVADDWKRGFVQIKARRRPLVSIDRVMIQYGQTPTSIRALNIPQEWFECRFRTAEVNVIPVIGLGPYATSTLYILAIAGANLMNARVIPNIVTVDYTAGLLPASYNPASTDVMSSSLLEDARELLKAVRYLATADLLKKIDRTYIPFGGSIGGSTASQSKPNDPFGYAIKKYEEDVEKIVGRYLRPRMIASTV